MTLESLLDQLQQQGWNTQVLPALPGVSPAKIKLVDDDALIEVSASTEDACGRGLSKLMGYVR